MTKGTGADWKKLLKIAGISLLALFSFSVFGILGPLAWIIISYIGAGLIVTVIFEPKHNVIRDIILGALIHLSVAVFFLAIFILSQAVTRCDFFQGCNLMPYLVFTSIITAGVLFFIFTKSRAGLKEGKSSWLYGLAFSLGPFVAIAVSFVASKM